MAEIESLVAHSPADVRIERVDMAHYPEIQRMNQLIFAEARVINSLERPDLLMLVMYVDGEAAGFKIGYGESKSTFYSAKGGVLARFRKRGLAREMLHRMMAEAASMGYRRFAYDTFPNKHPGMTVLGLAAGFRVTAAGYNAAYRDYRIRFEKSLAHLIPA